MEESQNQTSVADQEAQAPQEEKVSFPTVGGEKKNSGAKTLLIIGILVLVGVLGYVIYKSASGNKVAESLTGTEGMNNIVAPETQTEPEATVEPSATPSDVDKADIKIQVQNGTGITGEAAYLQNILKGLDYTDIAVGNAATQDNTETQVSFTSSVPSSIVTEITDKLEATYQTVTKVSSTSTTYDIVIITGLRKGATAKPSASPEASASPTASASPSSSPNN